MPSFLTIYDPAKSSFNVNVQIAFKNLEMVTIMYDCLE